MRPARRQLSGFRQLTGRCRRSLPCGAALLCLRRHRQLSGCRQLSGSEALLPTSHCHGFCSLRPRQQKRLNCSNISVACRTLWGASAAAASVSPSTGVASSCRSVGASRCPGASCCSIGGPVKGKTPKPSRLFGAAFCLSSPTWAAVPRVGRHQPPRSCGCGCGGSLTRVSWRITASSGCLRGKPSCGLQTPPASSSLPSFRLQGLAFRLRLKRLRLQMRRWRPSATVPFSRGLSTRPSPTPLATRAGIGSWRAPALARPSPAPWLRRRRPRQLSGLCQLTFLCRRRQLSGFRQLPLLRHRLRKLRLGSHLRAGDLRPRRLRPRRRLAGQPLLC